MALVAALLLGITPASAQSPQRAGVIVVHGDGATEARCVDFTETEISGYELLARAGFDLYTEASSMGATICRIDGEGCGEGEACFCQCEAGPCRYWTYWRAAQDGWSYANLGAGNTVVSDGVLEAWVWGAGEREDGEAHRPPALTFAEVCATDAQRVGLATPALGMDAVGVEPWVLALIFVTPLVAGLGWWWINRSRTKPS